MSSDLWATIPLAERSIVRAYINSENDADRERAQTLCRKYKLDYAEMRKVVLAELIAQSRELGKAWTPAEGSRPLEERDAPLP